MLGEEGMQDRYRLYLDEVGSDQIKRLDLDNLRYFSLTGVVMKLSDVSEYLSPEIKKMKARILKCDPDVPVCLHRSDILGCNGPFQCLKAPEIRSLFDETLLRIMKEANYTVITAFIDKKWMCDQHHWSNRHPYHYLAEIIAEKYVQFLHRQKSVGDIMPESRDAKQNNLLQTAFDNCRAKGTNYLTSEYIESAIIASKLKFRTKKDDIAGLQLCDLIAHPSHYIVRERLKHVVKLGKFAQTIKDILVSEKYDRSKGGKIDGYGIKHLP